MNNGSHGDERGLNPSQPLLEITKPLSRRRKQTENIQNCNFQNVILPLTIWTADLPTSQGFFLHTLWKHRQNHLRVAHRCLPREQKRRHELSSRSSPDLPLLSAVHRVRRDLLLTRGCSACALGLGKAAVASAHSDVTRGGKQAARYEILVKNQK